MKFLTLKIYATSILKLALFFLIFIQHQYTKAQQAGNIVKGEIQGKITTQNGSPISDVSIVFKDTNYGTSSNKNGFFSFYAPEGNYTLLISALGYNNIEKNVFVNSKNILEIDFKLKETSEDLDQVVLQGTNKKEQIVLKARTATKSNMSLLQTPAAVVVVDKMLLDQQANTTIQEAIRNVSGLTQAGNNYGIGDNLIIRGLGANYAYDGMYAGGGLGNNYNPVRSLTNISGMEILKGPATGLYGIGSAGGLINMVEKKPLDIQQTNLEFQYGKWNHYRGMLDVTGPINNKTSYRIVAATEAENGYRDLSSARDELYASLRHNFSNKSEFLLSAAYIDDENQIDAIGDPVRILNEASLIDPDAGYVWENLVNDFDADNDGIFGVQLTDEQRQILANSITDTDGLLPYNLGSGNLISPLSEPNQGEEFRVKLRHNWTLSNNTNFTQQLQYRTYESEFTRQTGGFNYIYWNRNGEINAGARAPLVIDDVIYPFAARRQEYRHQEAKEKAIQYFADLQNVWESNKFKGEHLLSFNYEKRAAELMSWSIWDADGTTGDNTPVPYILDIRDPNWPPGSFWDYDPSLRTNYDKAIQSYGVSFQEVLYFNKTLTGRFGAAYSTIKQTYESKATDANNNIATPEADTDDSGFSYNLGLNYMITNGISAFANYAKGRTAYSILGSVTGEDDRPDSESKSFDLGLRFTAFQEKLLASLVYFETKRTNLRYANELYNDNIGDPDFNVDVPQYFYDDEDKTEGLEFDLRFIFDKHWSMNANATYQDAISIRADEASEQTKGVPKKYARFWGEYKHLLGKSKTPVRFNFGMRYESERTVNSTGFGLPDAYLDSYVVWDTGLSFDLEKWNVRLNVANLFDERYYSKAMFLGGLPGESRNAELTLRYTF
ncbi:TonB-dependent receptor [Flavivirga jejuensis]|uniref:TonB-dependent receptor n=1 Tax=Flavivirga jejuensis TaxID=870487 RepID=A0ABT8WNC5_9FLAO|nr:TonB-dependent receptor [Flavivirga jejuensis]MDO5974655.1 TonB-dependent receptor [Flavivirga jejuensis]